MKLQRFKEKDNKRIGIILFTIVCILLVSGVILYRTFAIFEVKTNQNIINGQVQDMGDLRFMVYVGGELQKDMPNKDSNYSLDTSKSYCEDITNASKKSHINWNQEKWSIEIKDIGTTKTKCYLYFDKLYVDDTLNGAIPDLGNELVAITFDGTGQAVKADLTKEWYDYSKQEWANAIILRNRSKDYAIGSVIPEEDIESYFVWIPRYEYQLWNGEAETQQYTIIPAENKLGNINDVTLKNELNKQQPINIHFVTKNEPIKVGSNKGDYITHPAFTSFDSNGFWVGKFETGYNQDNDGEETISTDNSWNTQGAQKDTIDSKKLIVKPNVYSWRMIRPAHAFYTSYNYRRSLDSHMIKNSEWGAVTYLTNSKYGRCPNNNCTEVRINNNSNYMTGMSAKDAPTCGYVSTSTPCNQYGIDSNIVISYSNPLSVESSTTNNYFGVYDMVGGAWEYVMAVLKDEKGNPVSGRNNVFNSNFVGTLTCPICKDTTDVNSEITEWTSGLQWPLSKYYDLYDYDTTEQNYNRGHLGDGTKELGPFYEVNNKQVGSWYADDANFVYSKYPWFIRSGDFSYGTAAGMGVFYGSVGNAATATSFRIVLSP